jgi:hypothetical protein
MKGYPMTRSVLTVAAVVLALAAGLAPALAEEAEKRPLLDLIDAANKRMADLRKDATLMSAQKELRIAQEAADTRTFLESRVWPVDATVIDVTRAGAPGKYALHLDAPQLGVSQVDIEEPLTDDFVMGLNKGAKVKIFVRLTATMQGETLKLGMTGASIEEKRMTRTDSAATGTDRSGLFGVGSDTTGSAVTGTHPAPAVRTALHINCGGPAMTINGVQWQADQEYSAAATWGYIGSTGVARTVAKVELPSGMPLPVTPEMMKPFQSARTSGTTGSFSYQIDVPNGKYFAKLGFCDAFSSMAGQRVFSVEIQGKPVQKNLDVYRLAGARRQAIQLMFRGLVVTDGKLLIQFDSEKGAPLVNSIEVFSE